jgi:hypothetical protein
MPAIQAIAAVPLVEESWAGWLARHTVDLIALFLPRLDAVTRTEWLLYDVPPMLGYGAALAGLVVYTLLLVAAGLVDFYRRSV